MLPTAPSSATMPADRPAWPLSHHSDAATIQSVDFPYRRAADQDAATPARHPVVVVGAGPVGLSLAIDLAQRGQRVLLLDNDSRLSTGSRAICFAKRTLEVWDRLGVADPMCARGVEWQVGKVFFGREQLYHFNLLPESGHARPAFINLQQYYAEAHLSVRAAALPLIDLRWKNTVVAVAPQADGVLLGIDTPEGRYQVHADQVVACDGSRSPLRAMLGQESRGRVFRDRFLIADVRMDADFPTERWFWFDPPFHPGQSVLLHKQPDGVWRMDFQLGWDADPDQEKQPERIAPRVQALLRQALGRDVPFTLEWASVYTFACQRMAHFRHGRVLFAGDAAHGVSPFGARGANSGVQDADNLGWKLAAVLQGRAPDALLDTYASEREFAADENIRQSTRATDFITPKSEVSRLFRDAVLQLSRQHAFARTLVNSGRLSTPSHLVNSPLNTPDASPFGGALQPGSPAADAPVTLPDGRSGWLLRQLGEDFCLLLAPGPGSDELLAALGGADAASAAAAALRVCCIVPAQSPVRAAMLAATDAATSAATDAATQASTPGRACATLIDHDGLVARRYDLQPGSAVLLRPDQHLCARWRAPTAARVREAVDRALGHFLPVSAAEAACA